MWLIIMVNKIFIIVDNYSQFIFHGCSFYYSVRRENLGHVASNQNRSRPKYCGGDCVLAEFGNALAALAGPAGAKTTYLSFSKWPA